MYTDIKTFEDACEALKVNPVALPDFSMMPAKQQKGLLAHAKLILIALAINEGWEPNWKDDDEAKYYPWFDMNDEDGGFSYGDCGYGLALSTVGSRLCFSSRDKAKFAGTQFTELYKAYFVLSE